MFIPALRGFSTSLMITFARMWPIIADLNCWVKERPKRGAVLTDIWRFVRAVGTVLLSIAAPAFGDTGHLVFANKLLGAARLGVIICFGNWKRKGRCWNVIGGNAFQSQTQGQMPFYLKLKWESLKDEASFKKVRIPKWKKETAL